MIRHCRKSTTGRTLMFCAALFALGSATHVWSADETVTGDLTIQTSSPQLFFEDTSGTLQTWSIFPDSNSFDIIDDTNGGSSVFKIVPNVGVNRIVVKSRGVGLGNLNPNADLHITTRENGFGATVLLQARSSGGSTSRQWVVRGGEDHFNVEDLTASQRPFIVQVGSPTNALFVASNSSVGMGTSEPTRIGNATVAGRYLNLRTDAAGLDGLARMVAQGQTGAQLHLVHNGGPVNQRVLRIQNVAGITSFGVVKDDLLTNLVSNIFVIKNLNGNIGLKVGNPLHPLHLASGAHCTAGGVWTNASSRDLKQDIEPITSEQARETVRALQPVGYRYKNDVDENYVGFIAEDVPELVATNDRKSLAPMDIVAVLTKVVQDQERQLEADRERSDEERQRNDRLEATVHRQQRLLAKQEELLTAMNARLAELERGLRQSD